jgi:hypothetical protein
MRKNEPHPATQVRAVLLKVRDELDRLDAQRVLAALEESEPVAQPSVPLPDAPPWFVAPWRRR